MAKVRTMDNPTYRRRRPPVACTECRRRKIRCDRVSPCGPCTRLGRTCVYNHLLPKDHTEPLSNSQMLPTSAWNASMFEEYLTEASSSSREDKFWSTLLTQRPTTAAATTCSSPKSCRSLQIEALPSLRDLGYSRLGWLEFLRCDLDECSLENGDLRSAWERYRALVVSLEQARMPLDQLHWSSQSIAASGLLPSRATCDILVDLYVNTFESVTRILHIPSFLDEYKRYWIDPEGVNSAFLYKLLLAMATGIYLNQDPTDQAPPATHFEASPWILCAQQWLAQQTMETANLNIDTLQIGCLLLLSRQTTSIADLPAWLSDDWLLRMAMRLGFHQEPRLHFPRMPRKEAEIRRRLWATLLEISLQASLDSGLPAPVLPEDFDTEAPSNFTDADLNTPELFGLSSPSSVHTVFTHSTVQILLAKTQRTRLGILRLINSPGISPTYHEAMKLANELSNACNANLRLMQTFSSLSRLDGGMKPTEPQIKMLDTWTRRFLLVLFGPYADQAQTDHSFYYARKARIEASTMLLSYPLSQGAVANSCLDDQYTQLQISGQGIFRNVLCQATSAVCRDLIDELAENAFPVTDRENRQKLYNVLQESIAIHDQRMQVGQPTAQEYVAFLCAATQIDSMRAGRGELQDIVQIAIAGFERCCAALETAHQRKSSVESLSPAFTSDEDFIFWGDSLTIASPDTAVV